MSKPSTLCRIGLPQWHHPNWPFCQSNDSFSSLSQYSKHFSSVEGNTTFYGLPSKNTVERWQSNTPSQFRFCFKLPAEITHQLQLRGCQENLRRFFEALTPIHEKIGLISIQLPAQFSPAQFNLLKQFHQNLPSNFQYAIEVRHLGFFDKSDQEKRFNHWLQRYQLNRTMFDTRALFASNTQDAASLDAKLKKPRLPLHVIATGNNPMIRLMMPMHWNQPQWVEPWIKKLSIWLDEGRSPYLFLHTPDNQEAHQLACWFVEQLEAQRPQSTSFTPWPKQPIQEMMF